MIHARYSIIKLKDKKPFVLPLLINNLLLITVYGSLMGILGWKKVLMVQVPVLVIFGSIAFWFFYSKHQYEDSYKEWKDKWDHLLASIRGSTYYKLPRLFQWLTGNIGFHHIHHLNSRIPNYHLERCATENPQLNQYVNTLTFRQSLKCINNKLWDEQKRRMVSFKEYHREFSA